MSKRNNNVGWTDYTQKYGGRKIKTINPDVQSGSSVLFENFEDMQLAMEGNYPGVDYGTHGLSTQKAFEGGLSVEWKMAIERMHFHQELML
jgi:cystathionine beta-lyase